MIGQLAGTYILCEGGAELVVIDQHAAHERIRLHHLRRDPAATFGGGQRLLTPLLFDLSPARARAIAEHLDLFASWGLDIAPLGGRTYALQSIPAVLRHHDLPALLAEVADEIAEDAAPRALADRLDHILATLACHTSVRAGQPLGVPEMVGLLRELDDVDFSVCAHGRPVVISIRVAELERRFHRT